MDIQSYEEYIENWAQYIKTPLALMTFVLGNRGDEMTPVVYHRLEYVRSRMQEDIEQILYYARLKSPRTDYLYERVSLKECCANVLKEYDSLLHERNFSIVNEVVEAEVLLTKKDSNLWSASLSVMLSNMQEKMMRIHGYV